MKLNGYIMSKDSIVVEIKDGEIINRDINKCPLSLKNGTIIDNWIKSRAIDNSRVNSRLLKKALGIKDLSDFNTVLYNNAANITDNFWYKDKNSNLKWEDVKFKGNDFYRLALLGDTDDFNKLPSRTPELTNIGSFDKGWKLENGNWWLYKVANENQKYCENYISKIGEQIFNFNMAKYESNIDNTIKSLDFTENNKYNYEPMFSLIGENTDYSDNFNLLLNIDQNLAEDYLKIIYLDTLCQNMDRHTFNYGVLRDPENGKILKLAPNFDNNVALIYNNKLPEIKSLPLDRYFYDFLKENTLALLMLDSFNLPIIEIKELEKISDKINSLVDKNYINEFIVEHQKIISKNIDDIKLNDKDYQKYNNKEYLMECMDEVDDENTIISTYIHNKNKTM